MKLPDGITIICGRKKDSLFCKKQGSIIIPMRDREFGMDDMKIKIVMGLQKTLTFKL